jgi:hypothetical protein
LTLSEYSRLTSPCAATEVAQTDRAKALAHNPDILYLGGVLTDQRKWPCLISSYTSDTGSKEMCISGSTFLEAPFPGGARILTASSDNTARIGDVHFAIASTKNLLLEACALAGWCFQTQSRRYASVRMLRRPTRDRHLQEQREKSVWN